VTFSGEIFFSSKVPEFLHVLFNSVVKHFPDKRRANRGGKNGKNSGFDPALLCTYAPRTCAFITCTMSTHTNKGAENLKNGFLLLHQSAKWPKEYSGMFYY